MSIETYRRYRREFRKLTFDGRIMPYNWGSLPDAISGKWGFYSMMFSDFSREIANEINQFNHNIMALTAWAAVTQGMSDQQKMAVAREFVEVLATNAVNTPYVIRSRFIFATAHLCHQANRSSGPDWRDDLPADDKIQFEIADKYGAGWRKYGKLKASLEKIAGAKYRDDTFNFRNMYNHRFSPNFMIGLSNFLTRSLDSNAGTVIYGFGSSPALELDDVVRFLTNERNKCYKAFDAFQMLVKEQEDTIQRSTLDQPHIPR